MDTLTHALIGATVARATAPADNNPATLPMPTRLWLGGLAAAFPDSDYITVFIDPLSFISDWHRAETHSFIMLPLWALLLGLLSARLLKRQSQWREISLICALSITSHILSDLITSWGTQIFAPFSNYRAGLGTTFIIDPYLSFIVLTGLVVSTFKGSRTIARAAVALLVGYVGMQGVLKWQAYEIARSEVERFAWQQAHIDTMPQPFSPFNWKLIIRGGEQYHLAYLDLLANEEKPLPVSNTRTVSNIMNHYRPASQLNWSHYSQYGEGEQRAEGYIAWSRPEMERYRRFAAHPAFKMVTQTSHDSCVIFIDLRFTMPQRHPVFSYAACKDNGNSRLWRVRPINTKEIGATL